MSASLIYRVTGMLALAGVFVACEPPDTDGSRTSNELPQTHLSVGYFRADSSQVDTLGLGPSRVGLAWWGEDPDGWVEGFQYRWINEDDENVSPEIPTWQDALEEVIADGDTTYLPAESDTFIVNLTRQEMTVRFEVRAIDNEGGLDQSPAVSVFSAYNQNPSIDWVAESQEYLRGDITPEHPLPDTSWTFPWLTFHVNIWDVDGNETVTQALWALDDTTAGWNELNPDAGVISLDETQLLPGPHRMFVKAQDVANAWSRTLTYPPLDTLSGGNLPVWMVRDPAGELLVVFDDGANSVSGPPVIHDALGSLGYVLETDYSWWDVTEWLPYDDIDFNEIMRSFGTVFWISWKNTQMIDACDNLDLFMAEGGKLLMSTSNVGGLNTDSGETYVYSSICVPVDSLTNSRDRLLPSHSILPESSFSHYPVLHPTSSLSFMSPGGSYPGFGFTPDSSAVVLYFAEEAGTHPQANIAARQPADHDENKAKQIYFSIPLHRIEELDVLLQVVLNEEFNW